MVTKRKISLLVLSLVFLLITSGFLYNGWKKYILHDHGPEGHRTLTVMQSIIDAAENYAREFGHFPSGETRQILDQMGGQSGNSRSLSKWPIEYWRNGVLIDGWKQPIKCYVGSDGRFVVYSFGRNRRDDGGNGDDFVFSTGNEKTDGAKSGCCGDTAPPPAAQPQSEAQKQSTSHEQGHTPGDTSAPAIPPTK